jgi:phage-related protein
MVAFVKPIEWVGSSLEDLKTFPENVRKEIGYALYVAQRGEKHFSAKPMQGFKGSSVLEIFENYDGDTCRAVDTVKFVAVVDVLHAFPKKSTQGISTPKKEMRLIERRLKPAQEHYLTHFSD